MSERKVFKRLMLIHDGLHFLGFGVHPVDFPSPQTHYLVVFVVDPYIVLAEGCRCSQTLSNVRVGSTADPQHHAHLRPLLGVKRTSNVRFQGAVQVAADDVRV